MPLSNEIEGLKEQFKQGRKQKFVDSQGCWPPSCENVEATRNEVNLVLYCHVMDVLGQIVNIDGENGGLVCQAGAKIKAVLQDPGTPLPNQCITPGEYYLALEKAVFAALNDAHIFDV